MQKKINNIGFTLVELVVVLIITATLATLALPRITFAIEKVRAKEGEQFLYTLLSAQKRYAIDNDNGDATPDYTIDIGALDVDFSRTPENFDDPTVSATSPLAQINRNDGSYTLFISDLGTITCNCSGGSCETCQKLGYATEP